MSDAVTWSWVVVVIDSWRTFWSQSTRGITSWNIYHIISEESTHTMRKLSSCLVIREAT